MENINIWAVVLASALSFGLGGLWYSRLLFETAWRKAARDARPASAGHPAAVFVLSFALNLIAAGAFALWLGPQPPLGKALEQAVIVGAGFVATSFGINYQFANRGLLLWLIDGGYHALQFVLFGLVLGLWH